MWKCVSNWICCCITEASRAARPTNGVCGSFSLLECCACYYIYNKIKTCCKATGNKISSCFKDCYNSVTSCCHHEHSAEHPDHAHPDVAMTGTHLEATDAV